MKQSSPSLNFIPVFLPLSEQFHITLESYMTIIITISSFYPRIFHSDSIFVVIKCNPWIFITASTFGIQYNSLSCHSSFLQLLLSNCNGSSQLIEIMGTTTISIWHSFLLKSINCSHGKLSTQICGNDYNDLRKQWSHMKEKQSEEHFLFAHISVSRQSPC